VVRSATEISAKLAAAAGEKYSYREMDDFTDLMEKALLGTERKTDGPPLVAKVIRTGILGEKIYLFYSQDRLADYGLKPESLQNILSARNISMAGGQMDLSAKSVAISPTGEFQSEHEIGDVTIGATPYGAPLYLRDVVDIMRGYENPPSYLEYHRHKDAQGHWQRTRAITLSLQMGAGQQIDHFAKAVDKTLDKLKARLPKDLIIARTSDQPEQVAENVDLFMDALYEAIGLVVLVSLVGFWEWRSALLMAFSIPITLLMTFGMMYTCGIDLQQVSIATLIIALGLLVDDPVVAGDAIKRNLANGNPPVVAAWLGPTKLAKAIMYATVTNVVAYLPFLLLSGNTGQFLYSLPITIACSLIASRIVSMTFIPLLGYYLLRPKAEPSIEERRKRGFTAVYYRAGHFAIAHRWAFLVASFAILGLGGFFAKSLKRQFFPKDLSHLAYASVMLSDDAPFALTNDTARRVEEIIERINTEQHRSLDALSTSVGGGSQRFWYSLSPESRHANYAQIIMMYRDKRDTTEVLPALQRRLSHEVAGARIDVRQLETGDAVGLPVQIRISGEDIPTIRTAAARVKDTLRGIPIAARLRDDWGEDRLNVDFAIDSDRANLAGVTNLDAARASAAAVNGYQVSTLRENNKQIPIVVRLRPDERVNLEDLNNLYVYSSTGTQ
jgi:multidrug efflux pump subunit AcrB